MCIMANAYQMTIFRAPAGHGCFLSSPGVFLSRFGLFGRLIGQALMSLLHMHKEVTSSCLGLPVTQSKWDSCPGPNRCGTQSSCPLSPTLPVNGILTNSPGTVSLIGPLSWAVCVPIFRASLLVPLVTMVTRHRPQH